MANIKISEMTAAASVTDTTEFEVNDSGNTRKATGAQIKAHARDGLTVNNGTWSGTDLSVENGGTGVSTFTDGGVLIGNGTGAVQVTTAGTAGQVLTSNGTGVDPTFQDIDPGFTTGVDATNEFGYTLVPSDAGRDVIVSYDPLAGINVPASGFEAYSFVRIHNPSSTKAIVNGASGVSITENSGKGRIIMPGSSATLFRSVDPANWYMLNHSDIPPTPYVHESSATLFFTGVEPGDLLLGFAETAAQAITIPSGYTQAPSSPQSTGTSGATTATRLTVFYKIADGTETSLSVSSSGLDHVLASVLVIKNVDVTTPFDVTSGAVAASSTSVSMPTVTTTRNNTLVVNALACSVAGLPVSGWSNSTLKDFEKNIDTGTLDGNDGRLIIHSGSKSAAGLIAATTGTLSDPAVQAKWTGAVNVK